MEILGGAKVSTVTLQLITKYKGKTIDENIDQFK